MGSVRAAPVEKFQTRIRVLLVGEHDKGLGEPFPASTTSGRRLRAILSQVPVDYGFANMMAATSTEPTRRDARRLARTAGDYDRVVLLGRRVQSALGAIFPQAVGLPHPASRRKIDLAHLNEGLAALAR